VALVRHGSRWTDPGPAHRGPAIVSLTLVGVLLLGVLTAPPARAATAPETTSPSPLKLNVSGSQSDSPLEIPVILYFNATASGGAPPYSVRWQFGDGASATGPLSESHEYTVAGDFLVLVIVQDAAGHTAARSISVATANVTFPLSPTASAAPQAADTGTSVAFDVTSDPGTSVSYNWSFGDGTSSPLPSPTHVFDQPGEYAAVLHLEYLSDFSGQWSDTPSWNVSYIVDVVVLAEGAEPMLLTLASSSWTEFDYNPCGTSHWTVPLDTAAAGGVAPMVYDWQFGDGSSEVGPSSLNHTYSTSTFAPFGPIVVVVTDANGSTASATIAVPEPIINFPIPALDSGASQCPAPPILGDNTLFLLLVYAGSRGAIAAVAVALGFRRRRILGPLPPRP
jgi:PKD repeat protein